MAHASQAAFRDAIGDPRRADLSAGAHSALGAFERIAGATLNKPQDRRLCRSRWKSNCPPVLRRWNLRYASVHGSKARIREVCRL